MAAVLFTPPVAAARTFGGDTRGQIVSEENQSLMLVGDGQGDYDEEVVWRRVAQGDGNFLVKPRRVWKWWVRVLIPVVVMGLLALAAAVALWFVLGSSSETSTSTRIFFNYHTTTTTTMTKTTTPPILPPSIPSIPHEPGSCVLWGDPHIETFDDWYVNLYTPGEYWLVKSDKVNIQARTNGTKYTPIYLAATTGIAVGGSFLGGNIIEIPPTDDGPILMNSKPLVGGPEPRHTFSIPGVAATLTYSTEGIDPDGQADKHGLPKRVVYVRSPEFNVNLQVFRWPNYLDVRLAMMPQPLQDGLCGNLNERKGDDGFVDILRRNAAIVSDADLLFSTPRVSQELDPRLNIMVEDTCNNVEGEDRYQLAKDECELYNNHGMSHDACMFNVCFGSRDRWVEHKAKRYMSRQALLDAKLIEQ